MTELRPELSFDPADPAFIEDPYPTYAVLREAARVFHDRARERWFVTRFEDVRDCLRDRRLGRIFWHLFSAEQFGSKRPFWQDGQWPAFDEVERWDILFLEPPDHTRIRKLIASAFTPRSVERLREPAAKLSEELIDPLLEAGRFELMAEYAQPYSIALIAQLLGVPFAHHRELLDWSHRMVKMYEFDPTDQHKVAAERAAAEFRDFCIELIRQRRARPTEDLISALVHADVEGARLSDGELISTIIVLLNAGHEASVNTTGNGIVAFARHPDEWRRVVGGEVEPAVAAEEMIRWDPPLQMFERYVLADGFSIGETPISMGEKVSLLFGSANRDPRQFPDPDRFDAGRNASHHVGFGGGIHFCIGAPLARIELAVTLRTLAARMPVLQLTDEPIRHPTFQFHGYQQVRLSAQ